MELLITISPTSQQREILLAQSLAVVGLFTHY